MLVFLKRVSLCSFNSRTGYEIVPCQNMTNPFLN